MRVHMDIYHASCGALFRLMLCIYVFNLELPSHTSPPSLSWQVGFKMLLWAPVLLHIETHQQLEQTSPVHIWEVAMCCDMQRAIECKLFAIAYHNMYNQLTQHLLLIGKNGRQCRDDLLWGDCRGSLQVIYGAITGAWGHDASSPGNLAPGIQQVQWHTRRSVCRELSD